mmetsp:Transcript_291/g.493  ORF Transcript_291/g.493 Transcript_291/m.493 type:complete len:224 (-) Transcript_291:194-865(-)
MTISGSIWAIRLGLKSNQSSLTTFTSVFFRSLSFSLPCFFSFSSSPSTPTPSSFSFVWVGFLLSLLLLLWLWLWLRLSSMSTLICRLCSSRFRVNASKSVAVRVLGWTERTTLDVRPVPAPNSSTLLPWNSLGWLRTYSAKVNAPGQIQNPMLENDDVVCTVTVPLLSPSCRVKSYDRYGASPAAASSCLLRRRASCSFRRRGWTSHLAFVTPSIIMFTHSER